ncbi:hypothetical protein TTHERM_00134800 (macronuclear) [Tetrahymena thermophila SB210]|uniref:Uncharacterized protein n=1 Tax=Tetrahymena thermophila (strain SB210) TaxID=312017 RepID=I7LVN6_TETTS|nr:hypothetical protein TTHERM_00134800 [Tetrahymena thermophila SB210]EAR99415.2 hypothetical protein TTHERM_00134800 [Tetrahymena thermophila SB210]|eukprot:XP_001019660.2 hypothetical protein TTHERM_00134800 [Tetrahymena thermophila SB210]
MIAISKYYNKLKCPSEDKTHVFDNPKQFISHLAECEILKEFALKNENQDGLLKFLVCPKNFYHLKLVKEENDFDLLTLSKNINFCRCLNEKNSVYANQQRTIQFKQSEMKDYLKFYFIAEENKLHQDQQSQIVYQDLEDIRSQFLKSQLLTKNIQKNKLIYFKFNDELYQNVAQFRLVKDHQGMKQYIQKHEKIDEQFEIIPRNEINLICEDQAFIRQSLKPRIIMEVETTNFNSFRIQNYFGKKNFVSCVRYKDDILLMFNSKKLLNMSNSDNSFFIMNLEQSEYLNLKEREKYDLHIAYLRESYKIKQELQANLKNKFVPIQTQELTSSNYYQSENQKSIMCENQNILNSSQHNNQPQTSNSPQKNTVENNKDKPVLNNLRRVIKKVNKNDQTKILVAKKIIVCPKRVDENLKKVREKCLSKIVLLKERFEFYLKKEIIFQRLQKQEQILEEELKAIQEEEYQN